jgi:restriction system protein
MTRYFRVRLGNEMVFASQAREESFVGVDFAIGQDLSGRLPDAWREFNKEWIPILIQQDPGKSKVGAGLNCAMTWTLSKGMQVGDFVFSPMADGTFIAGYIDGGYHFMEGKPLPHRRPVKWLEKRISRDELSFDLWKSMRGPGTVVEISSYAAEIDSILKGAVVQAIHTSDPSIEDASVFALERHLEDFLVANWSQTILAPDFDIYEIDGQQVGQQYPTDTGPIDILAISKDRTELLVIELKRGRASDTVVGQVQRYMGSVLELLAESNQKVSGLIIALDDDLKIRRALSVAPNIRFLRYEISFRLMESRVTEIIQRT